VSVRAILDTTAIQAYAAGSIAVGELIGELSDEGVQFGLPALCLIEAASDANDHTSDVLAILAEHPSGAWLPLDHLDWRRMAAAAHLLGSVARACAALPVIHDHVDYLVTAEPEAYPGLNVIGI
jgi:hypothetical protein